MKDKKAKDPNFDIWSETWDGTWTLFQLYWGKIGSVADDYPDYVRENMTIQEIKQALKGSE